MAKEFVSFCSNSDRFLECLDNKGASPSITTSWEASLEIREIIIDSDEVKLSRFLTEGILVTPRAFPLRSIPSSISSFKLIKIVSGKRDHTPGLVI